ncbi:hypothetical protein G6F66_013482 [Rhizopus arrhizus]|nr:hypothetical protein G6F66_013482 [Rhizopus arrhizus]
MTWKSFLKSSLNENIEKIGTSATYSSLATVRPDLTPAVRTVVMRGFLAEHYKEETGYKSDLLVVITDRRSRKIKEIQNNPNTEINWYMNGTMSQFRIGGRIHIVSKDFSLLDWNTYVHPTGDQQPSDKKSLALEAFERQKKINPWEAERLRQFILFTADMRANMLGKKTIDALEIEGIDEKGWFQHNQLQELLEEAYSNFTLLVIEVKSVSYWSPSTGSKSML